ncbi:DNA-(apurinic or apyrimidinic site) endonuclease 2 [Monosporozyma unispora]|nr:Class II abasic (AP) endonuclease [Kazachstania unispora]
MINDIKKKVAIDEVSKTLISKEDQTKSGIVRFVTFNVNAVRTLFQYQPFSHMRESLSQVFDYLDGDIITFQELKIEKSVVGKWGQVDGFQSFISIPTLKKGYSGVGCWVRQYQVGHPLHEAMKVVKAEEGITGYLSVKVNKTSTLRYRDDPTIGIGGYHDILSEEEAIEIDSQGRCVIVELGCGLVVFSTYCPANSQRSEDGEIYRMKFLKVLFGRIRNLEKVGKNVVLMGDLNICRDLMDSAELLEDLKISTANGVKGTDIDVKHLTECHNFIVNPDTPHRKILNHLITDSLVPDCSKDGVLIDSTRYKQGRDRLKMYTVWNTQKNTRPSNYGSRVDFILVSDKWKDKIQDADILPNVMGSDHCPMYTDVVIPKSLIETLPQYDDRIPRFEARYKYDLLNHNILSMFSKGSNRKILSPSPSSQPTFGIQKKRSASKSNSIDSFFTKSKSVEIKKESSSVASYYLTKSKILKEGSRPKSASNGTVVKQKMLFKEAFGKPPTCKHGEDAILKTSRTSNHPGKKFWTCSRSRGSSDDKESSCGFFQWV